MSRPLFLPLAGFEVTFNGRFWVTAEAPAKHISNFEMKETPNKTVSRAKSAKDAKVDFDKKKVERVGSLRA
jgi:hypothetical protein